MTNPPRYTDPTPGGGKPVLRWVIVAGVVALLVVIVVIVLTQVLGGENGGHGPQRHTLADASEGVA